MTYEEMLAAYENASAAHAYIIGFIHRHILYSVRFNRLPTECIKQDRTSSNRGGYATLRLRISSAIKKALIANGEAEALGSEELLHTTDRYNKGERYERIVTERAGITWNKDSVPFWVAGDISVNGEEIQIKLDGATFATEPELRKIKAA